MISRSKILKNPDNFSVDEIVQAIRGGVVTLKELQDTGLLSISKRYAVNAQLGMRTGSSSVGSQTNYGGTQSSGNGTQTNNYGGQQSCSTLQSNYGSSQPSGAGAQASNSGTQTMNSGSSYDDYGWGGNSPQNVPRGNSGHQRNHSNTGSNLWLFILIPLVLIGIGCGLYFSLRPLKPEKIYNTYKKSVVFIAMGYHFEAKANGKPVSEILDDPELDRMCWSNGEIAWNTSAIATGTGFFISKDGKIATCKHVVTDMENQADSIRRRLVDMLNDAQKQDDNNAFWVQLIYGVNISDNTYSKIANSLEITMVTDFIRVALNDTRCHSLDDMDNCSLVKANPDKDLDVAIIQLNSKKTPNEVEHIVDIEKSLKKNGKSKAKLDLGKTVCTIGFPLSLTVGQTEIGIEAQNLDGKVTQECGGSLYGHNINVHQGASGAPIFDERGRFAGIVVSGFLINGANQGYNHAVDPNAIAPFLINN